MKKIYGMVLGVSLLAMPLSAFDVWRSSSTQTNDGVYKMLCATRGILHGVCTNFGVAAASTTIVNSSWTYTATGSIPSISNLVADQCKYYDVVLPSGMGYQKTNVAGITILYQCY